MISGVREKRHVLEQMQLSFEFQDLYDFVDRETRDASETQEEIEMRSYGSHLRFEDVSRSTQKLSTRFQGMNVALLESSMMSSPTATTTKGNISIVIKNI